MKKQNKICFIQIASLSFCDYEVLEPKTRTKTDEAKKMQGISIDEYVIYSFTKLTDNKESIELFQAIFFISTSFQVQLLNLDSAIPNVFLPFRDSFQLNKGHSYKPIIQIKN